jgi:dTDP-glucose pyrophosphorylase/predicted transcriptional regulator
LIKMDWETTLVPATAAVGRAFEAINAGNMQICLVVDNDGRLLGTITDGDVRRAILAGMDMSERVDRVMNASPCVGRPDDSRETLLRRMAESVVHQIPIVDANGRVIGLTRISDLVGRAAIRDNWVVLMAGGLGQRLRPLTENAPKPLLRVGDKPLLETILENFIQQDFRKFFFAVNYKAHMIRDHFGDGSKWNAEIRYLDEDRQLGTAGALRLIEDRPQAPIIVMNGDLLTRVNFQHLLDFHLQQGSRATMCVRQYDFQVPFGVVHIDGNSIRKIDEKPLHSFFVNAGIYALDPDVIDIIPEGKKFDMTTLFERVIGAEHATAVFPIHEYWLDVGRIDDLEKANGDFNTVFEK